MKRSIGVVLILCLLGGMGTAAAGNGSNTTLSLATETAVDIETSHRTALTGNRTNKTQQSLTGALIDGHESGRFNASLSYNTTSTADSTLSVDSTVEPWNNTGIATNTSSDRPPSLSLTGGGWNASAARRNDSRSWREQSETGEPANASREWESARDRATRTRTDHRIQQAAKAIERAEAHRDELNRTVQQFAAVNISLPAAEQAVAAAAGNLSQAREALDTARAAFQAGNYTRAEDSAETALHHAVTTDARIQAAAVTTQGELTAHLDARIGALQSDLAQARVHVERMERRYGEDSPQAQAARQELREAEQALERSNEKKQAAENATTLQELASSSRQAADDINAASSSLQRTRETIEAADRAFYRNLQVLAVLVAILTGSGFLYYRIDRDEWKEKVGSWGSTD